MCLGPRSLHQQLQDPVSQPLPHPGSQLPESQPVQAWAVGSSEFSWSRCPVKYVSTTSLRIDDFSIIIFSSPEIVELRYEQNKMLFNDA
jgi:hypothetical protein